MQQIVGAYVETYEQLSMDVNVAQTKLLIMRYNAPIHLSNPINSIDGNPIEKIERFNYLGSIVSSSRDLDAEINQRIWSAAAVVFKLNRIVFLNEELHTKTEVAVYKYIVRTCYVEMKREPSIRNMAGH